MVCKSCQVKKTQSAKILLANKISPVLSTSNCIFSDTQVISKMTKVNAQKTRVSCYCYNISSSNNTFQQWNEFTSVKIILLPPRFFKNSKTSHIFTYIYLQCKDIYLYL